MFGSNRLRICPLAQKVQLQFRKQRQRRPFQSILFLFEWVKPRAEEEKRRGGKGANRIKAAGVGSDVISFQRIIQWSSQTNKPAVKATTSDHESKWLISAFN